MNYNNNNLNPTSGYWDLSLNSANPTKPTYGKPFTDLSYCNTTYLKPIIDNKQQIDASFSILTSKLKDFGTFMSQFSAKPGYNGFNSKDPNEFCEKILKTTDSTTGDVSTDPSYNDCNTKVTELKTISQDINNGIATQSQLFTKIKEDVRCKNTDYDNLQNQYQSLVQRRHEIDVIMNEYNKKNANSLTQAHLQETDMLLYTSVLWIVLGTSALYFSFRYLND
jgi:hypothetical protein